MTEQETFDVFIFLERFLRWEWEGARKNNHLIARWKANKLYMLGMDVTDYSATQSTAVPEILESSLRFG